MAGVVIPVSTKYDGRGIDQAEKDLKRLQREQVTATRQQIAEHRKVTQLTSKLDQDLAEQRQAQIQQYKDIAAAAAVAGGVIIGYSKQAIDDARESAAAEAQLRAGIESTGGAAGQTLEALKAHAAALQDITNFSDEAIEGGQSILLTFTNIKETFPEATKVMLDMAERMGKDLPGAANTLGKALNDPINGLASLTRFGVQFTDQQKDQIKAMVEMGDVAGAQRIILQELQVEFGGSAEAAREAAGAQKDLEVSTGELSEAWGRLLLAVGDAGVTGAIVQLLDTLSSGADAWTATVERVREVQAAMGDLSLGFNLNLESFKLLAKGMADLNPFVVMKNGVMEFYKSLEKGKSVFESWRAGIEAMVSGLGDLISGILGNFTNAQKSITSAPKAPAAAPAAPTKPVPSRPGAGPPPSRPPIGFASGVDDFIVPPGFPNDSYTVGLTSGERVSVAPAGQGGASVIVNVNGPGGKELAAIMEKYAKMAVKEYHDTIISPWTNAG